LNKEDQKASTWTIQKDLAQNIQKDSLRPKFKDGPSSLLNLENPNEQIEEE